MTETTVLTVVSLVLNTIQVLYLAYLRAKFRDYPSDVEHVTVSHDNEEQPPHDRLLP